VADALTDGNIRIYSVPSIANINAPTVAELNAGTDLSASSPRTASSGSSRTRRPWTTRRSIRTFNTQQPGRASWSGTLLRLFRQTGTDTVRNTLDPRVRHEHRRPPRRCPRLDGVGHVAERRGLPGGVRAAPHPRPRGERGRAVRGAPVHHHAAERLRDRRLTRGRHTPRRRARGSPRGGPGRPGSAGAAAGGPLVGCPAVADARTPHGRSRHRTRRGRPAGPAHGPAVAAGRRRPRPGPRAVRRRDLQRLRAPPQRRRPTPATRAGTGPTCRSGATRARPSRTAPSPTRRIRTRRRCGSGSGCGRRSPTPRCHPSTRR
jgi:hypothetical protein